MITAKLFSNGGSQAVRLPKTCRLEGNEVFVSTLNGVVMLIPHKHPWATLINSLNSFTGDFLEHRRQPKAQNRKGF